MANPLTGGRVSQLLLFQWLIANIGTDILQCSFEFGRCVMDKAVQLFVVFLFVSVPTQMLVSAAPNLPDHIVLYFNFDEDGVKRVSDFSGHQNHGVITGEVSWEASQYGKALVLDGSVAVVNVPPSDSLTSLKAPMSVGVLFKPLSFLDGWQKMFGMYGLPDDRGEGWALEFRDQEFNFVLFGKKNHWGVDLKRDEWIHVITVFDGKTVDYYVDGVLADQIEAGGDTNVTQSPGLWLGAEAGVINTQPVNVVIDEVWISNKAISEDEIKDFDPARLSAVTPGDKLAVTWGSIKA
jgi:hypothetical protein